MDKSESGYDVFLLDIRLGNEECFPLLKKIKDRDPNALVLMLSGYEDEEHILKSKKLGADGFIHKPFKMDFLEKNLLNKINASLTKKERESKN